MADTALAAASSASPKKAKASEKTRSKPVHPRTSEMVGSAISNLKERGGSSLQAIKKYISTNYKVDSEKLSPFIKRYLKGAVASGQLVQTKGTGASGSFKLASTTTPEKAATVAPAKRMPKATAKKAAAKKPVEEEEEKKKKKKKPKKAPSKAKKAAKVPTKKPKAPIPKKATPSPKKAAPKRK